MVSIIIPCKNRLNHLLKTYALTRRVQGDFEVIIVDYRCPMDTTGYFKRAYPTEGSKLKLVKADVGPDEWNLSHARNIGFQHSTGETLLFIDADTMLKPEFLVNHVLKEGEFYSGSWLYASGCCMVWKKDFLEVKGYNEVAKSWGSEDYNLYSRLKAIGLNQVHFNEKLYKNIPHPDKIRNQYHGKKDIHVTNEENYQAMLKEFKSCLV